MFIASIVACGVWLHLQEPNCFQLKDNLGPYDTIETCATRTNQMEQVVISDKFRNHLIIILGQPPRFTISKHCVQLGELL